jgi:hypothetical protein
MVNFFDVRLEPPTVKAKDVKKHVADKCLNLGDSINKD